MKVLWLCGLPNVVRLNACNKILSPTPTPEWSWILGHLPPHKKVDLHIICPVVNMNERYVSFGYLGATWHCIKRKSFIHIISYIVYHFIVWRLVCKLKPDVVHGWGGETGFGSLAAKLSESAVVSVQGILKYYCDLSDLFKDKMNNLYGKYMLWREKRSYRSARILLTESETSKKAILQYYNLHSEVIFHPLRSSFLRDVDRNNLKVVPPIFLFVGALDERKGALDAVRAFVKMPNEARLVIIGSGVCENLLRKLVHEQGVSERVEFKGKCTSEEIFSEMKKSHFYLLPSYGDTGPTSLKEALACGMFPICYDNSGPLELLTHYKYGFLAKTGDLDSLVNMMKNAITDMSLIVDSGAEVSKRVRADLNSNDVWEKLYQVYLKVR